jgi:hypothetical protein
VLVGLGEKAVSACVHPPHLLISSAFFACTYMCPLEDGNHGLELMGMERW